MINEIRLKRFTSEFNCYKVESSGCPALREVAEELRIAQDKLSRRNMQIKDLREVNQGLRQAIAKLQGYKLKIKSSPDILFCEACGVDTAHNPDCMVCGSKE